MEDNKHVFQNEKDTLSYANLVNNAKLTNNDPTNFNEMDLWDHKYYAEFRNNKTDFFYMVNSKVRKEYLTENQDYQNLYEGLKLHVSVHPQYLEQGWKVVKEVMAKYDVAEAKIANPIYKDEVIEGQPYGQEPGKEITIYAFKDPQRNVLHAEKQKNSILGRNHK